MKQYIKEDIKFDYVFSKFNNRFKKFTSKKCDGQSYNWGVLWWTILVGIFTLSAATSFGQSPTSQTTTDYQVNTFSTYFQIWSRIAMDDDGNYIIIWASNGQSEDLDYYVYGQRYNSSGEHIGTEFQLTTSEVNFTSLDVAMNKDGNFVIVWSAQRYGTAADIYVRVFNSSGGAMSDSILVNTYLTGNQEYPAVSMSDDGSFVVTWQSEEQDELVYGDKGVYAQRFNSLGEAQGSEFRVNNNVTGIQIYPDVAMDSEGGFVITWSDNNLNIYAKQYDKGGVIRTSDFLVNTSTSKLIEPSIAMNGSGNFIICWVKSAQNSSNGNVGVFAQRYNSLAMPQGAVFQANSLSQGLLDETGITMDDYGNFVITWTAALTEDIYAQLFNSLAVKQGSEFRLNDNTSGSQNNSDVAMSNKGYFVVTWSAYNLDGSYWGIGARGYTIPNQLLTTANLSSKDTNDLILYPNPTSGRFQLETSVPTSGFSEIQVVNSVGCIVHKGAYQPELNLLLPPGVYQLIIRNEDGQMTKSFVIE
ncbi:MAG: T9SS type A sorting domain-containing protein [Cytophagaceae bacterium]